MRTQTWYPPASTLSAGDVEKVTFHYEDPRLRGEVVVRVDRVGDPPQVAGVPGAALLEFVGSRIKEAAVDAIGNADWSEFTGGLTG